MVELARLRFKQGYVEVQARMSGYNQGCLLNRHLSEFIKLAQARAVSLESDNYRKYRIYIIFQKKRKMKKRE